jgi:hypothetical protein
MGFMPLPRRQIPRGSGTAMKGIDEAFVNARLMLARSLAIPLQSSTMGR